MPAPDTIAVNCTDDITDKLKSTKEFGKKIFSVYSEEDLMDRSKALSYPSVGVMYEGLIPNPGSDPSRQGLMADLKVSVILLIDGKGSGLDRKNKAAEHLDEIRSVILTTKSPTGHKWRFVSETPVGAISGVLVYQQRWATACPLTR